MILQNEVQSNLLQELSEFIRSNPDPRELKRALAVQMVIQGFSTAQIESVLEVSSSFISLYKTSFAVSGVEGLRLRYVGSKGYLDSEQRQEIILWLKSQEYCLLEDLINYVEEQYHVVYKSKQSYYDLFHDAGISWKKSQKKNPKKDTEKVKKRGEEIKNLLDEKREEIESGRLVVYIVDECHLLWGDACGYVWGKTSIRVEVPITNERERYSYYGALEYVSKHFLVRGYKKANSENTVDFVEYLRSQHPGSKILIIWDGASYHRYKDMKTYLEEKNSGLSQEDWLVRCELFAPNDPDQDPVEDIWLQAKNFIRKYWYLCKNFEIVKWLFCFVTDHQIFDFPKANKYGSFALECA